MDPSIIHTSYLLVHFVMKFLIALESIGFVHGNILIYQLVYLLVHIVWNLSSDASSVTEQDEN